MRKILFCIILYPFVSVLSTYAIEFELSEVIKQAREAETFRQKQIIANTNNIKNTEKQKQNPSENNNSEQLKKPAQTNGNNNKKEQ